MIRYIWKKIVTALLLVLLVCVTCMFGPVSDLRYYLILFYLFPVEIALLFQPRGENVVD